MESATASPYTLDEPQSSPYGRDGPRLLSVAFARCKQVEQFTGLKRGAIYQKVRDGLFTPPIKIGKRASAWPQHEIIYLNLAAISGKSEADIKRLVESLVAQRTAGGGE